MEWQQNEFLVSDDKGKLNVDSIFEFLTHSYWAQGRSKKIVIDTIDNSFTLGLFLNTDQIGFARVITDYSTFAYLCDVYILEAFRKKGLGHFLVGCLFNHPKLTTVKWLLKTTYSQSLYRDFEFEELESTSGWMIRK